jgi:hypothetical protein
LLERCFKECWRVLSPGGYMVLTFNNREPRAWAALYLAAAKADFELPSNGIIFQDGIPQYKHTSQSRRTGSVIGDFIISFLKPVSSRKPKKGRTRTSGLDEKALLGIVSDSLSSEGPMTPTELFGHVWLKAQAPLFSMAQNAVRTGGQAEAEMMREIESIEFFDSHRRSLLEAEFDFDGERWSTRDSK